jgi:membrane AbrB-like protein
MAQSLQPALLLRVLHDWPLFLGFTFLVMAASMGLGWWLSRHKVLPGTTAIWGLAPGAASAMVLMSEAYGADPRLVAFMQYTRVIIVTAVAALVARLWLGPGSSAGLDADVWALNDYYNVACTLGLVLLGMLSTRLTRAPAGAMLLPLVLGVFLQSQGVLQIELPPLLLMCAYACIGWTIGLRYTRATLVHARRALPRVLVSIAVLIVFGMSLAAALALLGGFDPLTAYLATSPGGADSVAIIATHALAVDVGFVMAMQVARFILVLLAGPRISRWVAQRAQVRHG